MSRPRAAKLLRRLAVAAVALVCAVAAEPLPAREADGTAAQARERVAYVSVIDAKTQQPVLDLAPDAFVVREDGNRREVLRVSRATSPMTIAVIVDNSQAAAATIPDLRRALTTFLKTVEGLGPTAIFTIADRPTVLQEYPTSTGALIDAANRIFHTPNSGATLLDAIAEVSRGIARRESDRAAIVIVSGENVEYGNLHYVDVLNRVRESGAMMYVTVLVNPRGSTTTDEERNRATVLDRGPRESGGMRIDVMTSMGFETQLRVFGEMLKSQYRVTYSRPESLIPPERFQVSAARPGLEAYGAPARGQEKK
jgi:hypothetical protein